MVIGIILFVIALVLIWYAAGCWMPSRESRKEEEKMDNHCCICGAYLADTSRMICPNCEKPRPLCRTSMSAESAIEMLKNPTKYMYIDKGHIELEGWLQEAIKMGIEALKGGVDNG